MFSQKYPNLESSMIEDIVNQVLIDAPDYYFSLERVQENQDLCIMCGKCCEDIGFCEHFNGRTCDNYDERFEYCKRYPYDEILNESVLLWDIDCNYALKLAEMALDEEFRKNIELMEVE